MKKLFLAMIVCAGFCACSNDDVVVTTNPNNYNREATAYLTVNINDVNSGTRASSGGFAYGTTEEQAVSNAYFYFYDASGNYMADGAVASVTGTASQTGTGTENDPTYGNIEWKSNTLVAVYGLYADQDLPTQMLTVLNKPSGINLEHQSLDAAIATLAGNPYADESGNFVMSTSVYEDTNAAVYTTALKNDDFYLEPINIEEDYPNGGVAVYVERLASKVGVNDGITSTQQGDDTSRHAYHLSEATAENFPMGTPAVQGTDFVAIQLLGFDVDGVARDAYIVKNIDPDWNLGNWSWNVSDSYRCYWAESPNYGVEQDYPTSSNGNTATEENNSSTWLNDYLRYVDLKDPVAIGSTTYCGENTNTVGTSGVIDAADNNGLTNVIVKAQFGTWSQNNNALTGVDLIEYHGEYYTAEDFLNKCVDDVVDYDFTVVVNEIVTGLETSYPTLSDYLAELNDAIIKDAVYVTEAVEDHKVTATGTSPTWNDEVIATLAKFDGSMLSLYKLTDGNVDIFFNGAEQYYGQAGDNTGTQVEPDLCGKYKADDIVYGDADLTKYEFYFHVDYDKLSAATQLGAALTGLIVSATVDGETEYYLPLDNSFYFTSASTSGFDDPSWSGGHTYTLRNFFLRAITVEADGIDDEFGSHYPNYFAKGMMYYHVPIEHLNAAGTDGALAEGEYGVVRNHWYNVTITSLEGLGRGIADEDEVIVPLPEVDYYYLGADINILSWQMVDQSVGF